MNKKIALFFSIIIIFIILLVTALIPIYPLFNDNKVLSGITISEVDIGGLTKEEAINKLLTHKSEITGVFSLTLLHGDNNWSYSHDDLEFDYEAAVYSAVEKAISYGHEGNIIHRMDARKKISADRYIISSNLVYDAQSIENILLQIKSELILPTKQEAISFAGYNKATYEYTDEVSLLYLPQNKETCETENNTPEVFSYFDNLFEYNNEIHPHEINIDKTLDEVLISLSDNYNAVVNLIIEDGKDYYDINHLKEQTTLVYQSKSKIAATSTYDRDLNVENALKQFDGLVLYPGDTVSFNDLSGEPTAQNGYHTPPAISSGPFSYSAGIPQAATVILNAAIMSGCDVVERHSHPWPSYFSPDDFNQEGLDAYVKWDEQDLVFQNNTDYIIYFDTYVYWPTPDNATHAYCNAFTMPLSNGQEYVIKSILEHEGQTPEPIYEELGDSDEPYGAKWNENTELNKLVCIWAPSQPEKTYGIYRITMGKDGNEINRIKLYDAEYEEIAGRSYTKPIPED